MLATAGLGETAGLVRKIGTIFPDRYASFFPNMLYLLVMIDWTHCRAAIFRHMSESCYENRPVGYEIGGILAAAMNTGLSVDVQSSNGPVRAGCFPPWAALLYLGHGMPVSVGCTRRVAVFEVR
jgi:hypothetical protein